MTPDQINSVTFCRFDHDEEAVVEVSLTDGCIAYPDDRTQFLREHHLNRLGDNGCLGSYKIVRYLAQMKPLGPDFEKVWDDNVGTLYEK